MILKIQDISANPKAGVLWLAKNAMADFTFSYCERKQKDKTGCEIKPWEISEKQKSISLRVGHLTITAEAEYYVKNCADRGECQHNS